MKGNVWILAEQWRGQLSEISFELLALGRELADQLGVQLHAVLLGHNAKELARALGKADKVLYADHALLAEPTAEAYAEALVQLIRAQKPGAVLVPLTNVMMDAAALVPAQLGAPFVNWCKGVWTAEGRLQAGAVLYGGKIEALVGIEAEPAVLGILPGVRPAENGRSDSVATVEQASVTLADGPRVRLKKYIEPEAGDVDISRQDILVSVGRGIQTQDNISLAQELAQALGGVVSGSRPVIDQGWLPLTRQVGKSGATVKPKLYLALGISGAPEHVEGMKDASLIIAVNTDPHAPIFNIAHYGVVADLFDFVPPLTGEIKKRQESRVA